MAAANMITRMLELLKYIEDPENKDGLPFVKENGFQASLCVELRSLRTILWTRLKWRDNHEHEPLESVFDQIQYEFEEHAMKLSSLCRNPRDENAVADFKDWLSTMERMVKHYRPAMKEIYVSYLKNTSSSNSNISVEFMWEVIYYLLENLKDLVTWKADLNAQTNEEIQALREKLQFFSIFIDSSEIQCFEHEKLEDVMNDIEAAAKNTASLSYFYWIDEMDQIISNYKVSNLLDKIKLTNCSIREIYYDIMNGSELNYSLFPWLHNVLRSFIKLLYADLVDLQNSENSLMSSKSSQIDLLVKGLFFLRNFVSNSPKDCFTDENNEILWTHIIAAAKEAQCFVSCYTSKTKEQVDSDTNSSLVEFLERLKLIKAELREICHNVPKFSRTDVPLTNGLGFINSFLATLTELLTCKLDSITSLKHEIHTIKAELESLRTFLWDNVDREKEHEELKNLRMLVNGVAYEAEYVIDFIVVGDGPLWYHMLCLFDVMEEIKLIRAEVAGNETLEASVQNTENAFNHSAVVGLNNDAQLIIDQLTRGSMQLEIVSIIGMGGIGKTTLATEVYNDPSITHHFHIQAWCHVSQVYQKRELLLDIMRDVTEVTNQISKMDDDELADQLRKCLKGRRFLLIMDDMWNIRAWSDLQHAFPNDENGSRVLFTSRIHEMANLQVKYKSSSHPLRLLSSDQSWELLQRKLFHKDGSPPSLIAVGKQIAQNCKGLPLAVVVAAGLLVKNKERQEWWEHVAQSLSSHFASDPQKKCIKVLELSYKNLPDYLKPCFLYFGAFQKKKEIQVKNLVHYWIAEGFVNGSEVQRLEEVAMNYLMDLIGRSLITVSKRRSNGGIKACSLHDMIHDFCLSKAEEEKFMDVVHGYHDRLNDFFDGSCSLVASPRPTTYKLHRLCIYSTISQLTSLRPSQPHVRTLLFFASGHKYYEWNQACDLAFIPKKLKLLRVLDLQSIDLGHCFPSEVVLLVHLRYLAIRGCMKAIPPSISCLLNLETFIVKGLRGEIELPDSIWSLGRLKHLHINYRAAFNANSYELKDFSNLQNLDTFSSPSLSYGENTEKILKRLPRLRKLRCIFSESWNSSRKCNQLPVLDALTELESLTVFYHGSVLYPCEFHFPSTIKKLTLSKFCLPWSETSILGKLPNLEVLKLLFRAFEGEEWDVNEDEFLKLKFLKLENLSVVTWNASDDSFPSLEKLVLHKCKKLQEIPSSLGDLPSLQAIEVQWCSQSAAQSVYEIQQEQKDMGNLELQVFIHPQDWDH